MENKYIYVASCYNLSLPTLQLKERSTDFIVKIQMKSPSLEWTGLIHSLCVLSYIVLLFLCSVLCQGGGG